MGFAGQVFAARVAVGLAVPSPGAFSKAGAMIGGFASNMYKKLNKESVQAAQNNATTAQTNLNQAQNRLGKHMKNQNSFLSKAANQSVNRLKKQYKTADTTAKISVGAMKKIGAAAPKPVKRKLFANINSDMKEGQRYTQMMKNFINLTKEERRAVINGMEAQVHALQGLIVTAEQKEKLGEEGVAMIKEDIAKRESELTKFKDGNKEAANNQATHFAKEKKLRKERDAWIKKNETAQQKLNRIMAEAAQRAKQWAQATGQLVGELKQNFNNALRESVAVLTAFYYKLNQNVQELVEFERELINANSVFGLTNNELFNVGETITQFGQKFGMEMQNGATGLYQLASAGVSANEALEILPETLKLSMAVQGDHNTISKLTAQTLFGFGMEMNQAAEITDKFAWAIQKSLIEYEDLSSAVKFALPFFTTTGQSIDQLLGALAVLTNRALEAGIAGRGLRQGLAELAESVGDNTAAFRKLGIEVTNQQGDMLQLTEIAANFAATLEEGVINDTELLTMLIEDLNVRGATAFVHLVQASDEFTEAVHESESAGGQLDEMVRIQNESLGSQIQILRNNVQMLFFHRDALYEGTEYMNAFHEAVSQGIESLQGLLVVETESGFVLSEMGKQIQEIAVQGVAMLVQLVQDLIPLIKDFTEAGGMNVELLKVYLIPLQMVVFAIDKLGPDVVKAAVAFHILSGALGFNTAAMIAGNIHYAIRNVLFSTYYSKIGLGLALEEYSTAQLIRHNLALSYFNFLKKITLMQILMYIPNKIAEIATDIWSTLVRWAGNIADAVANAYKAVGIALSAAMTIATFFLTGATGSQTVAQAASTIALFLYNISLGPAIAATWAFTAALIANPIGLLVIGIVLAVVAIALLVKHFFNLTDVFHVFMAMIKQFVAMWIWVAKKITAPFVELGRSVEEIAMTKLFELVMFLKHMYLFVKYMIMGNSPGGMADMFSSVLGGAIGVVSGAIQTWVEVAVPIFTTIWGWVNDIWQIFYDVGVEVYNVEVAILNIVGAAASAVWETFKGVLSGLYDIFVDIWNMTEDIITSIGGIIGDAATGVWTTFEETIDPILTIFTNMKDTIVDIIAEIGKLGAKIAGMVEPPAWLISAFGYFGMGGGEEEGKAQGGLITRYMANGGAASAQRPYMVGERGPELFMPRNAGRIVPNKDLNTQRVKNMLRDSFDTAPRTGAAGVSQANVLTVSLLNVSQADLRKTKLGVDTFG